MSNQRQLDIEAQYSNASLVAGQQQVLDAFKQGRITDVGQGRVLLAKAFAASSTAFKEWLGTRTTRGVGAKFNKLLDLADPDILVMAGLREILNKCVSTEPVSMQSFLSSLGRIIETESMLIVMDEVSAQYTNRTLDYLDTTGTKSNHHRYRTLLRGSETLSIQWQQWSTEDRVGVARLLVNVLYEATGLFKWVVADDSKRSMYYLQPSETLEKHLEEMQAAARAVVRFPPMVIKPCAWVSQTDGGYLTDWFRAYSPMCGLRYLSVEDKDWILNGLNSPQAAPVRAAMNKAQSVPYRVNKRVLAILRNATATRRGILGLPSFVEAAKPEFPFPDDWDKGTASATDMEKFNFWKTRMAAWYTSEVKRKGRHMGILGRIRELVEYIDEPELYFPTFIDWRGRVYFRSNLNPQASDAVKGCLEFSNGKVLGERGLFWLKVHVANCCGYDKHEASLKAAWTEEHWDEIKDFINNPLDVDAPESDTAFTLLQAGLALQEALSLQEPTSYICHVPVAMDATCSGLQHLSALTRDTVGATYTNLINNHAPQKSDIYVQVATVAKGLLPQYYKDVNVKQFWDGKDITRNMAKSPVMTYVYGSTLISCIETIALNLSDAGIEPLMDGQRVLYSISALATPVGKALREGVKQTVPKATEVMNYLQKLVRKHPDKCLRWVSLVGVPVVNWAEGEVIKRLNIRSMGVNQVTYKHGDSIYNTRIAANGIVPNYVHSFDASHLCLTLNAFEHDILPIHDSFATHPSDVDSMHMALRSTFITMYGSYSLANFLAENAIDEEEYPIPELGLLELSSIEDTPYMFS